MTTSRERFLLPVLALLGLTAAHCSGGGAGPGEGQDAATPSGEAGEHGQRDGGTGSHAHDGGLGSRDGATGEEGQARSEGGHGGKDGASLGDGGTSVDGSEARDGLTGADDGQTGHPEDASGGDGTTSHADGAAGHDAGGHLGDASGSVGDAGTSSSGDSGILVTCSTTLEVGPSVPATGYMMFVQGDQTYVLVSDYKSWTVVTKDAASAITQPIPLPSGVTSMQVLEAERAYDGTTLLLFEHASMSLFATFWNGATLSTPVALPADTVSIHADGERHLFAIDSSNELWDARSGSFVNRGIVPLEGGINDPGPLSYLNWGWTVSPSAVVTTIYAAYAPTAAVPSLSTQTFDASLAWSTPFAIDSSTTSTDWYSGILVTGGDDGSVHVAYGHIFYKGMTQETGSWELYGRSHASGAWQTVMVPEYAGTLAIVANTYSDVELLIEAEQDDPDGFDTDLYFWWATPLCQSTPTAWWETVQIQEIVGYYPAGTSARMAVNGAGYPSFFLWQSSGPFVVTTD